MIKEAIDRIVEMAKPNMFKVNDHMYVDKGLSRVDQELRVKTPLRVYSLTSLVDYVKKFSDRKEGVPYLIVVDSPTSVELMSALDSDRERETLMIARAEPPEFISGYVDNESFVIALQYRFVDDKATDRDLVMKFAGTVTKGSIKEYNDDGVTQKATIKQGVASKAEAIVPSPCTLRPYRTFPEVEQPSSTFIFRMREGRSGDVESALFEADGGAWKNEARLNIKRYLEEALSDVQNITVIS